MSALNLTGSQLSEYLNLSTNTNQITKQFRELGLIEYFSIGKKFLYKKSSADLLNERLFSGEVVIKSSNGKYYVTTNNTTNG